MRLAHENWGFFRPSLEYFLNNGHSFNYPYPHYYYMGAGKFGALEMNQAVIANQHGLLFPIVLTGGSSE
jgi:hypothetical protein